MYKRQDDTWAIIQDLAAKEELAEGICLSRNRGHQNALLGGLLTVKDRCDITISIDCDGQDDINAMDEMVKAYHDGCEVVYGVRSKRDTDTFFKRFTAEGFYKLMNWMGAQVVFNHADYRLLSSRVLNEFSNFKEVNIFLRGMVPLVEMCIRDRPTPSPRACWATRCSSAWCSSWPLSSTPWPMCATSAA